MINGSMHTGLLYVRVSRQIYNDLMDRLRYMDIPVYNSGATYIYEMEGKGVPGITSIKMCSNSDAVLKYCTDFHLMITINPIRALKDMEHKNSEAIPLDRLSEALTELVVSADTVLGLDLIGNASLSRVDFCVDLKFEYQYQADEYISLLRKIPSKKALQEVQHWDSTQRRMIPYQESFLLRCASYEFQVYPKYTQMINRGLSGAEHAAGVVRIELRASRAKLRYLYYKYREALSFCENWGQELIILAGLSKEIIQEMLIEMLGTGDFYPVKMIHQKIDASDFHTDSKEQMKRIVSCFALNNTGEQVLQKLGMSQRQWRNHIRRFSRIGCCPIPVPTRAHQQRYPGITNWEFYFGAS